MYDLFVDFYGTASQYLDPNIIAVLACSLGIFIFDCIFRVIYMAFRAMFGIRS